MLKTSHLAKHRSALTGAALLLSAVTLPTAFADESQCESTVDANPNIVIPVFIDKSQEVSTHPSGAFSFDSYKVRLGRNNELDNICINHPNAAVILRLQDRSSQYEFSSVSFFEKGGNATEEIPQFEVHPTYIRYIIKNSGNKIIKYNITILDKRNDAVIVLDPQASEKVTPP